MPNQRRGKAKATARGRRRRTNNTVTASVVIKTLTLKSRHNKEEVYPISLHDIISRANVGQDADINAKSYTFSVSLATGNDVSTVTANVGHSGPWVRRGQDANDNFDQQSNEHDFRRSKSVLFKVNLRKSEKEYLNPDTTDNYINLRLRDPCGVIPGVTVKMEVRFMLSRKVNSTTFADGGSPAVDLYEDQDVSTGTSSGQPNPPSALQDVPLVILSFTDQYRPVNPITDPIRYQVADNSDYVNIAVAGKLNAVGTFRPTDLTGQNLQKEYTNAGFEGTISWHAK